jgi:hypothetical protein
MWAVFSRLFIILAICASVLGMNMSDMDFENITLDMGFENITLDMGFENDTLEMGFENITMITDFENSTMITDFENITMITDFENSTVITDFENMTLEEECTPRTTVVISEDFEAYSDAAELHVQGNWRNARIHTESAAGNFTKFLGPYQSPRSTESLVARRNDPRVFYPVPFDSDHVLVSFDFYEIGGWGGEDTFRVILNGEKIDLGKFDSDNDEQYRFGSTQSGIVWTADSKEPPSQLGFTTSKDQIHHVIAKVPSALYVATGDITLRFVVDIDGDRDEACGIDNIMIEAIFEDFESNSAKGWVNGKVEGEPGFSNYLGRYDKDDNDIRFDPVKAFIVPDDATKVTIEWDFYEIDKWSGTDSISAFVNNIEIPLGVFNMEINESPRNGKTRKGITWSIFSVDLPSNLGGSPFSNDQKHRIRVTVPRRVYGSSSILLVRFAVRISDIKWVEAAGFDNIQLTAFFDCGKTSESPIEQNLSPATSPNFMPIDSIPSVNSPVFPSIIQIPALSPALSPHFTPNVAPIDSTCLDSNWTFFASVENPQANCTWLAENSEFIDSLCNKRSRAWLYCPVTCGRFT